MKEVLSLELAASMLLMLKDSSAMMICIGINAIMKSKREQEGKGESIWRIKGKREAETLPWFVHPQYFSIYNIFGDVFVVKYNIFPPESKVKAGCWRGSSPGGSWRSFLWGWFIWCIWQRQEDLKRYIYKDFKQGANSLDERNEKYGWKRHQWLLSRINC